MNPYFIWNGRNSLDMGVVVTSYPMIVRPPERVTQVTVPGRAGALTLTQGTAVYDGYIKTIRIGNRPSAPLQPIISWLRGEGTLILGNEPDFAYTGRIINQINFTKLFPGSWQADVQIWVQPFKRHTLPEPDISLVEDTANVVYNPGDVPSLPRITLTGYGSGSIIVAGLIVEITDVPQADGGIIIDCDAQMATTADGSLLRTHLINGSYPDIPLGYSQIIWQGDFTAATLTPRWRWL